VVARIAKTILASGLPIKSSNSGLRIEIVEPRYTVTGHYSEYPYQYWVMESQKGGGAVCIAKLEDANRAGQYADWLNSKEPA
jgi:hypothetical protein